MLTRSALADSRSRLVENLALNPTFRRASAAGSSPLRRNFVTNPRGARAQGGTNIVRRNLVPNPALATSTSGFGASGWGTGGAGTTDRVAGMTPDGQGFGYVKTWTASPTNSALGYIIDFGGDSSSVVTRATVKPGQTYTVSAWLYSTVAATYVINVAQHVAIGSLKNVIQGTNVFVPANTWVRHSVTLRVDSDVTSLRGSFSKVNGPTFPVGGQLAVTRVQVEDKPSALPYIDGNTPNTRGIVYSFEGAANASASIGRAGTVEVYRNHVPNPHATSIVNLWGTQGFAGATIDRQVLATGGPDGQSAVAIKMTGTSGTGQLRVTPWVSNGASVLAVSSVATILTWFTMKIFVPTGYAGTYRFEHVVTSSSTASFANSTTVALVAGWNTVSYSFTLSAATAGFASISGVGAVQMVSPTFAFTDAPEFRFTDAAYTIGTVGPGSFFSGNVTPDVDMTPTWVGTENNSASYLSGIRMNNQVFQGDCVAIQSRIPGTDTPAMRVIRTGSFSGTQLNMTLTGIPDHVTFAVDTYYSAGSVFARGFLGIQETSGAFRTTLTPRPASGALTRTTLTNTISGWSTPRRWIAYPPDTPGESLWITNLLITQGIYTGPYFDGDTVDPDTGLIYTWDSTAHDSLSYQRTTLVEVRRNLHISPQPYSGSAGGWTGRWFGGGGGNGNITVEQNGFDGRRFIRKTWTVAPTSPEDTGYNISTSGLTPGKTYTVGVRVRSSVATAFRGFTGNPFGLHVLTSLGTGASVTTAVPTDALGAKVTPGAWQWFWATFVMPADTDTVNAYPYVRSVPGGSPNWAVGDTLDFMDAVIYEGPYTIGYFDGNFSPDENLVASWLGSENASASILSGAVPLSTSANAAYRYMARRGGQPALALLPSSTSNDTFAEQGGGVGTLALGMQPGRTYTALAIFSYDFAPASLPGISAYTRTPKNGYVPRTAAAGAAAGTHTVRLTFTVEADATEAFIRLYHRNAWGTLPVYVLGFLLVEGVYRGPYFDGYSPNVVWRGLPNGSSSIGYLPASQLA